MAQTGSLLNHWGFTVALGVLAFAEGGVGLAGIAAFVRIVPAAGGRRRLRAARVAAPIAMQIPAPVSACRLDAAAVDGLAGQRLPRLRSPSRD